MNNLLEIAGNDSNANSAAATAATVKTGHQPTRLLGIGTALPPYSATQEQSCKFMQRVLETSRIAGARELALLKRLYKNSGIERRHSVIGDYVQDCPSNFNFFPQNESLDPFPTTAARMTKYEEHAVELAAQAAQQAIDAAGIEPETINHIVISTCTGFFAPGPDVLLLRKLGLPTTTRRTVLGFMGCYAGLSGLRVCNDAVQADPDAVVLQIAIELCSLHYQKSGDADAMVANAIFADGVAAAVWTGSSCAQSGDSEVLANVLTTHSDISENTIEHMSWRIGDHGFIMTLDAGVPEVLKEAAPQFVAAMAAAGGIDKTEIAGWAIHPGGRKIIEAVQEALALSSDDVSSSVKILRDFGNMSSATILFVIQEELRRRSSGDVVASMAFGPGLTMEGALLVKE